MLLCGLSASTNGLSFTSVAELAGAEWAGRALGVQNIGQTLTGSRRPALAGAIISSASFGTAFGTAFGCADALALVAVAVIPPDRAAG